MGEIDDRVRKYATGEHDIEKYKNMLGSPDKNSSWASVGWMLPKKFMIRMFQRMKIWKTMQAHKMIHRLKFIKQQ